MSWFFKFPGRGPPLHEWLFTFRVLEKRRNLRWGLPGRKPSEITCLVSIGFTWTPRQRGILVLKFTITEAKTNYTFQLFFPTRKHIANKWQSTWGGRLGHSEPANEPVPTCCRGTIKQSARARGGFKSLRTRLFKKALRQTGMSRIFFPSFTFSRELPGKKKFLQPGRAGSEQKLSPISLGAFEGSGCACS